MILATKFLNEFTFVQISKMLFRISNCKNCKTLLSQKLAVVWLTRLDTFLKMGQTQSLFRVFSSFQANITNKCEECPSSLRCWDSNPRPSEHGSRPITTRPACQDTFNCIETLQLVNDFSAKKITGALSLFSFFQQLTVNVFCLKVCR